MSIGEHSRTPNIESAIKSLACIGIDVRFDEVQGLVDDMIARKKKSMSGWHSDSSWIGWLKFAFIERLAKTNPRLTPNYTTAEFHFGFISVEETDEQLARLRNEKHGAKSQVARSKIGTTTLSVVSPVDRVAKRVSQ